jgi:hypothetical protein
MVSLRTPTSAPWIESGQFCDDGRVVAGSPRRSRQGGALVTASTRTQRPNGRPTRASRPSDARRSAWRAGSAPRGARSRRVGLAGGWIQRRQPQKSGVQKVIGGLGSSLPAAGKRRTKGTAPSGKAKRRGTVGGLAFLAAAAGVVFKNRDKITSKLSSDRTNTAHADSASRMTESSATAPGVADFPGPPAGDSGLPITEPSTTPNGPRDAGLRP